MKKALYFLLLPLMVTMPSRAQTIIDGHNVSDIEGIIDAAYAALERAPGDPFNWDLFHELFLPEATLIPNTEQRGGNFEVMSPQTFIEMVEAVVPIGGPNDRGFTESGYHNQIDRYGDIANVMSSYKKHFWGSDQVLGAGVNSFQLVWNQDRWWIVSIIWDEPYAAGPIPDEYGGMPVSGN